MGALTVAVFWWCGGFLLTPMDTFKIYPYSLDFTSGYSPRRKPKPELPSAITIQEKIGRPWYDPVTHEAVERPEINRLALKAMASDEGLSTDDCVRLYEAYEQAGNVDKAIACVKAFGEAQKREVSSGLVSRSLLSQKKSNRPRRNGLKGITSYGRRMVRSSVAWFFQKYSRYPLSMVTMTMPSLTGELQQVYCEKFALIAKRIMEAIRRQLRRAGLPGDYVWVAEIQPDRFKKTGAVALHIHALFLGRQDKNHPWAISKTWLAKAWGRILANHLGEEVNTGSATRIEVPKTDNLQGEMSKYMSKGDDILPEVDEAGKSDFLPRQWWGISADLNALIKSETVVYKGPLATEMDKNLDEGREKKLLNFTRIKRSVLNQETGEITQVPCGSVGRFKSEFSRCEFLERCRSLVDSRFSKPLPPSKPKPEPKKRAWLDSVGYFSSIQIVFKVA